MECSSRVLSLRNQLQDARANALRGLAAFLATEPGAAAAHPRLADLWPQLLSLLSEPAAAIRGHAAAAVGRLGTIAAKTTVALPGGPRLSECLPGRSVCWCSD